MSRPPIVLAALLALLGGPAPAQPSRPEVRDLEGLRLGLAMLGPGAERAFAGAGIEADPRALALAQIEATHLVLSRAIALGEAERACLAVILSPAGGGHAPEADPCAGGPG